MALAALPQSRSAFSRDPAWDEAIVPALRKRLETESQVLAKRMSAASMTSADGYDVPTSSSSQMYKERSATPTSQHSKPSAIPRPSLQQSRTGESTPTVTGRSSRSSSFQRNRTLSQPYPFEPSTSQSPPPLPPDSSSRSNSPLVSASRMTRIPISRARTGSVSSSHQPSFATPLGARGDSRSGFYKANGNGYVSELTADHLYPVDESHPPSSVGSRSTLKTPRSQMSELVNERPPFSSNTTPPRRGYEDDFAPPRMSSDSEERPFEHWYRGDVSRNGGVGELRVGRKQEMLEIANYGHALRMASSQTAFSSRSRSNSRGRDNSYSNLQHRPRAGSVGARESLYLDDEEQLGHASPVLDERPLTDLDDDDYDEGYYDDDTMDVVDSYGRDLGTTSPHSLDRSDTPTLVDVSRASGFRSRIPTPNSRQASDNPRTVTPTPSQPLPYDPVSTPKATSQPPPAHSTPKPAPATTGSTTTAKRKGKSPAPTTSNASKRARQKSPAKPAQKKKDAKSRESIAQYPAPEGDDIMHAVPSWTQPVPPSGNWDDVVLPVVARKKGLDEHYEQADGTPKPRRANNVVEPAPGTFGFDHSKYRGTRTGRELEDIPMDEFGQREDALTVRTEDLAQPEAEKPKSSPSPLSPPVRMLESSSPRPESPAPFSQYSAATPLPEIRVTRPSMDNQKVDMRDDDVGGGCCKCVIM